MSILNLKNNKDKHKKKNNKNKLKEKYNNSHTCKIIR